MAKSDNGGSGKVLTAVRTSGSISAANFRGSSSLGQSQMICGEIPFFLKISKIREIIYCVGESATK